MSNEEVISDEERIKNQLSTLDHILRSKKRHFLTGLKMGPKEAQDHYDLVNFLKGELFALTGEVWNCDAPEEDREEEKRRQRYLALHYPGGVYNVSPD